MIYTNQIIKVYSLITVPDEGSLFFLYFLEFSTRSGSIVASVTKSPFLSVMTEAPRLFRDAFSVIFSGLVSRAFPDLDIIRMSSGAVS